MAYFNRHLGLAFADDGSVELDTRPEHEVAPGTIHFAVLVTLAEVAAARATEATVAAVVPAAIHLNLMARAKPGQLVGRGTVLKRGRTLTVAEGEVFQGERLVAKATVTFAVIGEG